MQAIATLVQDDPYLKLSRSDRIAGRKARRAKLALANPLPPKQPSTRPYRPTREVVIVKVPEPIEQWTERQKRIYQTMKEPWFHIVDDVVPVELAPPNIEQIQHVVAKYYGVSRLEIISARRPQSVMRPRQVGYYLSKLLTRKSLPEIGRRFGGRDHTSVLSGVRKIDRLRATDAALDADIIAIATLLGGFPS